MLVLANGKKADTLELIRSTWNGQYYGLYVNDLTPVGTNVLADFTECTDTGYAVLGREQPVFAAAVLNGSNQGELLAPSIVWTFTALPGTFTVYGYFAATLASGGVLVYSERAATPFFVSVALQTYTVIPRYLHDTLD